MGSHRRLKNHRRGRNQPSLNQTLENMDDDEDFCSVFTCSVEAHPYGVLPGGNRFITRDSDPSATSKSSSSPCGRLDEELWQDVLSFCDGATLTRVVQTSRRFYVMGHTPELWRDLVLRLRRDLNDMGPSWKDTYVKMMTAMNNSQEPTATAASPPHRPIPMAGVYSDYLFRSHMCRSFSIPPHWLQDESPSIPRVKNLSTQDFLEQYEQANRPVVIAGAALSWPATQKWSDPLYFARLLKQQQKQQKETTTTFRATSGAAPLSAQFTLPAYLQYAQWEYLEEAPMYLFDRGAVVPSPRQTEDDDAPVDSLVAALQADYLPSLRETLPFWDTTKCSENGGHDLFQYLGEGKRPDHTWLIVGPRRSGSVFHIDPNCTHAWNANIVGRKRWIFYPPGVPPPGVYPSDDGDQVTLPLSIGEWLINYYETEHAAAMNARTSDPALRPCECTAEAGDVVFVPHGWWHMVVNLDDLNMAITHNYVSRSNLPNMLRFLRTQPDQISGCRDRPESIKPEQLYDSFCNALQTHHPDWLQEAQAVPDWTCRAWKSAVIPAIPTVCRRKRKAAATGESFRQPEKHAKENGFDCATCETSETSPFVKQNGHCKAPFLDQCNGTTKNSMLLANESSTGNGFRFSFL